VIAEATAPCQVELAGGAEGATRVGVAIDRRAWCRVETGVEGLVVESKDTLRKAQARTASELGGAGPLGLVARVLQGLGVETGVRVVTQSRVPEGAGLGEVAALGVAITGAAARALGLALGVGEIVRVARVASAPDAGECELAARGGSLAFASAAGGPSPEVLAADPGRVEESLLLVQCEAAVPPVASAEAPAVASVAGRVREALAAGRLEDLVGLWREEWEARAGRAPEACRRIAGIVGAAGGAVRSPGRGGSVLLAWAPPGARGPGRREAVLAAAREAGLRLVPARVDLRGLDVE
jgi:hypothetical protein